MDLRRSFRHNLLAFMKLTTKEDGHVTILTVDGDLVIGESESLFKKTVVRLLEEGKVNLLVDLRRVNFLDSSGPGRARAGHDQLAEGRRADQAPRRRPPGQEAPGDDQGSTPCSRTSPTWRPRSRASRPHTGRRMPDRPRVPEASYRSLGPGGARALREPRLRPPGWAASGARRSPGRTARSSGRPTPQPRSSSASRPKERAPGCSSSVPHRAKQVPSTT